MNWIERIEQWWNGLARGLPSWYARPPDGKTKYGEEDGSLSLRRKWHYESTESTLPYPVYNILERFSSVFGNFPLEKNYDKHPAYYSMTTRFQRARIDRYICEYYSFLAQEEVLEVPYKLCCASKCGILWIDLEADWEGEMREFHALIPNSFVPPVIGEGFRARKMANSVSYEGSLPGRF